MTEDEFERLLCHLRDLLWSNRLPKWERTFCEGIVKAARRRDWRPSPRQRETMRDIVLRFRGIRTHDEEEPELIERADARPVMPPLPPSLAGDAGAAAIRAAFAAAEPVEWPEGLAPPPGATSPWGGARRSVSGADRTRPAFAQAEPVQMVNVRRRAGAA